MPAVSTASWALFASGHYALCGIGEQVPDMVFGAVGKDRLEEVWRENAILVSLRDGLPDRLERCLPTAA